jgi:uncharacterized protein (TIGR00255 family)
MTTAANTATQPVRSMTGYALVRRQSQKGELTVSIRTVNHRNLDLHFYQPVEFGIFENAIRQALKEAVRRGHVEIRVSLTREPGAADSALDRAALSRYVHAFRTAAAELQIAAEPDLNAMLAFPGVLTANGAAEPLGQDFQPALLAVVAQCLSELNSYREREGSALLRAVQSHAQAIEQMAGEIRSLRAQSISEFGARLRERVSELLADASLPESRIAEEIAFLADRSDIEEELTRLTVHVKELWRMLEEGGELGKKLDFLLQEMNRETNTILSKSSGGGAAVLHITRLGLALKANIESIREQALNLE